MRASRQSEDEVPRAVLEFAYPLLVPGPEPEAAATLLEIGERHAPHITKAVRLLRAWSQGPEVSGSLFDTFDAEAWVSELSVAQLEKGAWAPLFCIAEQLRKPGELDVEHVALACLALSEWVREAGAKLTGVLLVETAALVWDEHPGYAWMAGRMLRAHGNSRAAEPWLVRAARLAVRQRNWDVQAKALNTLGNLYLHRGNINEGGQLLHRALRLAQRRHLREREAKVLHDLFVLSVLQKDYPAAELFASQAFPKYGTGHPDLPKLAHDVAHLWCEQGYFARALSVFRALLPHFTCRAERFRVLVSAARAAGGARDEDFYSHLWEEARQLFTDPEVQPILAEAIFELALGASSLGRWNDAREALEIAMESAAFREDHQTAAHAEALLAQVLRQEASDRPPRPTIRPFRPADDLAASFVECLDVHEHVHSLSAHREEGAC